MFAVGVATEGDGHHTTVAGEHAETGEHTGERILGINLESTPLVATAVVISVLLAAATWRRDHRFVVLITALFAAAFAALDLAEFSHRLRRPAITIAVIAAVIAHILHAAAALLAEQRRGAA